MFAAPFADGLKCGERLSAIGNVYAAASSRWVRRGTADCSDKDLLSTSTQGARILAEASWSILRACRLPVLLRRTIEVADTTLDYDSGVKLRAYEKGGIKEYWIIDIGQKAALLCKFPPQEHNYTRESHTHGVIAHQEFPDVTVDLEKLF